MSQELHYTSVPRGLKPGSRGFATVAATVGLPDALAERLEGLSGYQAVYPPGDPSEALNPVAFAHVRLSVGSQRQDVLSRIGPAGLDYSGRPNKYAHHIVLDPDERPEAGPAWLLSQPGLFQDSWQGEPRTIPDGPAVPRGDRPPGVAQRWQAITGDAGWAGVLAESFLADPRRPVFLVYRPGAELLPLFVEAIALLPSSRRWDVEFSTYLTTLPPGIHCAWRGVLDGSTEVKNARRLPGALVIDLSRIAGRARGGPLVHLARTGERLVEPASDPAAASRSVAGSDGTYELSPMVAHPPRPPAGGKPYPLEPSYNAENNNALPDLAGHLFQDGSLHEGESLAPRRRRHPAAAPVAAVLVVLIATLSVSNFPTARRWIGLDRDLIEGDRSAGPRGPAKDRRASQSHPAVADVGAEEEQASAAMPFPVAETPPPPPDALTAPPPSPTGPDVDVPADRRLAVVPPVVLSLVPPNLSRSSLGKGSSSRGEIKLPRPAGDRIVLRNAFAFRLVPVQGTPNTWEIARKSNSMFAAAFSLARLTRLDDRTWQFAWTDRAKSQASLVAELKDAILELEAHDGGSLYILLRGIPFRVDRPIEVWREQRLCDDPLGRQIRAISWISDPDALDRTRWKPLIRRWRAVITRAESRAGGSNRDNDNNKGDAPRRVVEPDPFAAPPETRSQATGKARPAPADVPPPLVPLECELIPGEVKLRLSINSDHPAMITVRVDYDKNRMHDGRAHRTARMNELLHDTPTKQRGDRPDPLAYRIEKLRTLRDNGEGSRGEREKIDSEIAELKALNQIRETEDLLALPVRVRLSLIVSLDIEGVGLIDIARVGNPDGDDEGP